MTKFDKYRVRPNVPFSWAEIKPDDRSERGESKASDWEMLTQIGTEINALHDIMVAQGKHKLLLILQGMDTSGKDGTVKHLFSYCNPLGIRLTSFKKPTDEELAHDFLWRAHARVPKNGEITIFNRSHYEDVLITRVHGWIDASTCQQRYEQISDFERMLVENGTTIIKCFLYLSKAAQKERLIARLTREDKAWKFKPDDLVERDLWLDYMQAYQDALEATSTDDAPWYVIPADSKTNRNLLISGILLEALQGLALAYRPLPASYKNIVVKD